MIEHFVLFQWATDASPEAIAHVVTELRVLIPDILYLTCGENFSPRSQGYTHALTVRLTNCAAFEAYGPHPAHQRVVQEFINPIREAVLAVDYEI
jgi:hypothetical protein